VAVGIEVPYSRSGVVKAAAQAVMLIAVARQRLPHRYESHTLLGAKVSQFRLDRFNSVVANGRRIDDK
jgi:hypothetical protein